MLVALASVKGSPGVTSSALALAGAWPRPVVLLEADTAGGDLAYRCTTAAGGQPAPDHGLLGLAAAVRGGDPSQAVLASQARSLACGVKLIQGVTSAAQGRGLAALWRPIAAAGLMADVDVIADLGRLERTSAAMPLAEAADVLLPVTTRTLETMMHLADGLWDLMGALRGTTELSPVVVGPQSTASRDRAQLDDILRYAGVRTTPSRSMPYDPRALARLERGGDPPGRLRRTALMRAANAIAASLAEAGGLPPVRQGSGRRRDVRSSGGPAGHPSAGPP
jgi:hypothetical protein